MSGLGSNGNGGDSQIGRTLKATRYGSIHRFLLTQFENQDLLAGLYKMALGERYLLKNDVLTLLKAKKVLNQDGTMPDEVKEILLESVVFQKDGTIALEL